MKISATQSRTLHTDLSNIMPPSLQSFGATLAGKIQPPFTETYTLTIMAGGGVRLWIDNYMWVNKWEERYPSETSFKIRLDAGRIYDLKVELFNTDDQSGCTLEWASPSLKRGFIPIGQLNPVEVNPLEAPKVNKQPVANAGADQELTVSTILNGSSSGSNGAVVVYKWEQIGGQPALIAAPDKAITQVNGLKTGEYVFRLTVTDDKHASASDEMTVVVK